MISDLEVGLNDARLSIHLIRIKFTGPNNVLLDEIHTLVAFLLNNWTNLEVTEFNNVQRCVVF